MKLDQILEFIQAHEKSIKQEVDDGNEIEPQQESSMEISEDLVNNGLMAIGGCRKCSRTFTDRLELIHHFTDHFPTIFYSFEPQVESSIFTQLAEILSADKNNKLKNEVKTVKSTKTNTDDKISTTSKSDSYYMCPQCCLTFADKKSFDLHLKTHTSGPTSSQIFACDQCDVRCDNLYSLEDHRRQSHKKLCYICGEQFETVFDFNLHLGDHSKNSYACKNCGKCFSSRKFLAQHNQTEHKILIGNESKDLPTNDEPLIEKPKSLLSSNLYFNGLVMNVSRRRKARNLRLNKANIFKTNPK